MRPPSAARGPKRRAWLRRHDRQGHRKGLDRSGARDCFSYVLAPNLHHRHGDKGGGEKITTIPRQAARLGNSLTMDPDETNCGGGRNQFYNNRRIWPPRRLDQLVMPLPHGYLGNRPGPWGLTAVITMPKLKSRKREMFAIEVAAMTPLPSAYVAAGYSNTPWARYNANKLSHTPEVAARIDELQAEFSERSGIHAEYLRRKLLPIVEANSQDLFEPILDATGKKTGDRLRAISDLPRDLAAAISKIKCDPETGAPVEIVLAGKIEAGSVLLRSVGGLLDRHEHTGRDGESLSLEAMIMHSYQRPAAAESAPAAIEKCAEANVSGTEDVPIADPFLVRSF